MIRRPVCKGDFMKDFTQQIMAMQSRVHKQLMRSLEGSGLSTGQPKILAYLKSHEGRCQKEIAQACQLEPGSLTVLLKRMERQGLIERRCLGNDRKTRYIYLTGEGRRLAALVVERFYAVEQLALSGISPEEEALFARLCTQILQNLRTEDEPE